MNNLKCFVDVNFTVEEDLSRFNEDDIKDFTENKDLMAKLFKEDLLERLKYFSDNIKDLNATVTFEE